MYGQPETPLSGFVKKANEDFIKEAIGPSGPFNGNRKEASKAWAAMANDFINKGDLDYAMRRYNQSWLLDENNYQPYWGFGQIIILQRQNAQDIDKAITFYEKAKALINDEYQKQALLGDLGIAYSRKARAISNDDEAQGKYFEMANKYFSESANMDRTYSVIYEGWANSLYHEKKYAEAWQKVKQAEAMGHPVNQKFKENLNRSMPEPK